MELSVIYKIHSRIIVVPDIMTRKELIKCITEDWETHSALRVYTSPLTYETGSARLVSPWTLEYVNRARCDLVKPC